MSIKLRLVDFDVKNDKEDYFKIQIFGLNKNGETHSIRVSGFNPFFYIKVNDNWDKQMKNVFIDHLKKKMGNYYEDSLVSATIVEKHKLYGFDNNKLHKFIILKFSNIMALNKAKEIFYKDT